MRFTICHYCYFRVPAGRRMCQTCGTMASSESLILQSTTDGETDSTSRMQTLATAFSKRIARVATGFKLALIARFVGWIRRLEGSLDNFADELECNTAVRGVATDLPIENNFPSERAA